MMMLLQVRIEAGSFLPPAVGDNQAQILEQPERPVDRVERNPRQPPPDTPVYLLGVRMIVGPGNLAEDLLSLVGDFNAPVTADRLEELEPPIYFLFWYAHLHLNDKNILLLRN